MKFLMMIKHAEGAPGLEHPGGLENPFEGRRFRRWRNRRRLPLFRRMGRRSRSTWRATRRPSSSSSR